MDFKYLKEPAKKFLFGNSRPEKQQTLISSVLQKDLTPFGFLMDMFIASTRPQKREPVKDGEKRGKFQRRSNLKNHSLGFIERR